MAREFALAGVDCEEIKNTPPPERPPRDFFDWVGDIWYRHKPLVILGAFFIALGLWLGISILIDNPPDYTVVVVTEQPLTPKEREAMEAYFAANGVDVDGDGRVEVDVESLSPNFSEAASVARADNDKLNSHLVTGEVMLFVFDPVSYEGFCRTWDQATGEDYQLFSPLAVDNEQYNADECYWNWKGDARIAEQGMSLLPEELYFGVRKAVGTAGGTDSKKMHDDGAALLKTMIETAKQ